MSEHAEASSTHRQDPGVPHSQPRRAAHLKQPLTAHSWRADYARRLFYTDLVVLTITMVAASLLRFGSSADDAVVAGTFSVTYVTIGLVIAVCWWLILSTFRTRDERLVGDGIEEYSRVARGTVLLFGWIAIFSLVFKWDVSRGFLAIAFPLGLVGLLAGRKLWRTWLAAQRDRGNLLSRVLVIGSPRSASVIAAGFLSHPAIGYQVTGVWVPDRDCESGESLKTDSGPIPVLGDRQSLGEALSISRADTVIVTDTEHLGTEGLKSLAWQLADTDVDLMVSPNVIDVAGPRIHVRGVANMPFIHLEEPTFAGAGGVGKFIFDKSIAGALLFLASPLLIATSILIKMTSRGPAIYRSERIGVGGEPFDMLKLRTMVDGADKRHELISGTHEGAGPLFKLHEDPRVTPVGAFLRRYSIDELPQLINVLKGDMSIVGPRPPLRREVEQYDGMTNRRLLVKQGITGLWQVSGRSNLTWDEAVRLDLDYVENWSLLRDAQILWKTVRAVIGGRGAY